MHDEFLRHDMGYCLWGGKAARAERRLFVCLSEISFACFRFVLLAGIGVIHTLPDPEPDRLNLQAPVYIFLNFLHHGTAGIANALISVAELLTLPFSRRIYSRKPSHSQHSALSRFNVDLDPYTAYLHSGYDMYEGW